MISGLVAVVLNLVVPREISEEDEDIEEVEKDVEGLDQALKV